MNKDMAKNCYECKNRKNCSKCGIVDKIKERTKSLAVKTPTLKKESFSNIVINDFDKTTVYAIPIRSREDIKTEENLESLIEKMGYKWKIENLSASSSVISESLLSIAQFSGAYDILIHSAGNYIKKYASDLIIDINSIERKIDSGNLASQCYYFGIRDYGCDGMFYMENRTSDFFDCLINGEETSQYVYCSKKNTSENPPIYRDIFKLEIEVCSVREGIMDIMQINSTLYNLKKIKSRK